MEHLESVNGQLFCIVTIEAVPYGSERFYAVVRVANPQGRIVWHGYDRNVLRPSHGLALTSALYHKADWAGVTPPPPAASARCTANLIEMGLPGEWTRHLERARAERVQQVGSGHVLSRGGIEVHSYTIHSGSGRYYIAQAVVSRDGVETSCECLANLNGQKCKHVALVLEALGLLDASAAAVAAVA